MGKRLPQLLTAMTVSAVLLGGCALPSPQRGGLGQGPMGGGAGGPVAVYGGGAGPAGGGGGAAPTGPVGAGVAPGGLDRGGGGTGVGNAGPAGAAGGAQAGATGRAPGNPPPDMGRLISNYVAGLDVINGGTNVRSGPIAGGLGGGGGGEGAGAAGRDMTTDMTGADTSRIGRGVGVSTMVVGNRAFIGIDPTTIGVGRTTGGADISTTGDARGPAGAGLEGYLRDRIRSRFPQVSEVYVTTDPALVSRIARISTAGFTGDDRDILLIMRQLAPASTAPR
ncbi:MAG TPA: hypothetical protein VD973_05150 [Symbiobacteriaceae bacterium]|nr:hypothetical protein [Symbiobacteriaceae bacterium]